MDFTSAFLFRQRTQKKCQFKMIASTLLALLVFQVSNSDELLPIASVETRFSSVDAIMVLASTREWKEVGVEVKVHEKCKHIVIKMLAEIELLSKQAMDHIAQKNVDAEVIASNVEAIRRKILSLQNTTEAQATEIMSSLAEAQTHKVVLALVARQAELSVLNKYVASEIGVTERERAEIIKGIDQAKKEFSRQCQIALKTSPSTSKANLRERFEIEWTEIAKIAVRARLNGLQIKKLELMVADSHQFKRARIVPLSGAAVGGRK